RGTGGRSRGGQRRRVPVPGRAAWHRGSVAGPVAPSGAGAGAGSEAPGFGPRGQAARHRRPNAGRAARHRVRSPGLAARHRGPVPGAGSEAPGAGSAAESTVGVRCPGRVARHRGPEPGRAARHRGPVRGGQRRRASIPGRAAPSGSGPVAGCA
ncbi:unnamed protein product, partial [Bubo scandiacus]